NPPATATDASKVALFTSRPRRFSLIGWSNNCPKNKAQSVGRAMARGGVPLRRFLRINALVLFCQNGLVSFCQRGWLRSFSTVRPRGSGDPVFERKYTWRLGPRFRGDERRMLPWHTN